MKSVLKISFIFLLVACDNYHIEEDAEKFCSCRRLNLDKPTNCNKLLDSLSHQYQFDPESMEYLSIKIEECFTGNGH